MVQGQTNNTPITDIQIYIYLLFRSNIQNYKSLYINGSDVNGDHRVVVRLTSLPGNHQQSEVCFLLRVRGIGDLVLPGHPSCHFDIAEGDGFAAAGLKCTVVEPLRIWRKTMLLLC